MIFIDETGATKTVVSTFERITTSSCVFPLFLQFKQAQMQSLLIFQWRWLLQWTGHKVQGPCSCSLHFAQPHRQEFIKDLYTTCTGPERGVTHGGLMRELLISFKKQPDTIFYKDGVNEGQFNEVLLNEMDKIQKESCMPPVTFIVVQKRNLALFFLVRHDDKVSTDRSGNILPGTVVDTKIFHPRVQFLPLQPCWHSVNMSAHSLPFQILVPARILCSFGWLHSEFGFTWCEISQTVIHVVSVEQEIVWLKLVLFRSFITMWSVTFYC